MLQKIVDVVRECGSIIQTAHIQNVVLKNKDRRNLLTEYDLRIQSVLQQKLKEILPEASFFGEEGEHHFEKDGYCFVCDPIDGTTNFVKGMNFSAISVALLKEGQPVIGVVYNPYLNEMFCAEKGKGATLNGVSIHSLKENLSGSLVSFGTGVEDLKQIDEVFEYARKCFCAAIDVRRSGSAALDLCHIACGRTGYFFELKLCPWDYSAGALIVEEAGGIVKSKDFVDIDDYFKVRPIFAFANKDIYQEVSRI